MGSEEDSAARKKNRQGQEKDPLTFVFWGIGLLMLGLYVFFTSQPFPQDWSLLFLSLGQSILLLGFGTMILIKGIKDELVQRKTNAPNNSGKRKQANR